MGSIPHIPRRKAQDTRILRRFAPLIETRYVKSRPGSREGIIHDQLPFFDFHLGDWRVAGEKPGHEKLYADAGEAGAQRESG